MGIVEDLADSLAIDVIAAAEETGDEGMIQAVADMLEAASTTTYEAYMTAIRVRLAEAKARKFLAERMARAKPKAKTGA
jgi:hypothetical protein